MTIYQRKLHEIRNTVFSNERHINTVIEIRNFIENNYDMDLNLDVLSRTHCVSKYHLLRLFKAYYGLTPRQYLMDKRIEMSKGYLIKKMTVTEACFAVGFESVGSFSTLFKIKTGESPSQFQKKQLSRSNLIEEFSPLNKH